MRFYDHRAALLKVHPRVAPGKKSIDASDFPDEKRPYAMRDVDYLERHAAEHGAAIGQYAHELLAGPLPWTRMRQVRALLSYVRKYGAKRVEELCEICLAADMLDVTRLRRMLEQAAKPKAEPKPQAKVIPIARYLRKPSQYALPLGRRGQDDDGGEKK